MFYLMGLTLKKVSDKLFVYVESQLRNIGTSIIKVYFNQLHQDSIGRIILKLWFKSG